jgi:hypothetical protein
MYPLQRAVLLVALLVIAIVPAACSQPPDKEMNQAQGAVDAAREAGGEQYATEEYRAAVETLQRSRAAVVQGDYRLALSEAIDARARALEAAKHAATGKARVRGDVERTLAELSSAAAVAEARLKTAQGARVSASQLAPSRTVLDAAQKALQEARSAIAREDYVAARSSLEGHADQVRGAIAGIDQAIAARQARPTRRRRQG